MFRNFFISIIFCTIILFNNSFSQEPNHLQKNTNNLSSFRMQGFIGFFHNSPGTIYGGWGWPYGELIQTAFNFGENAILNSAGYTGYTFQDNLTSSCTIWDLNKVYGILIGPSEKGAVNQPADTALFQPFSSFPGMIQGAHRFSELSKIYPQIQGVIIDDFYSNYPKYLTLAQLQEIKDALLGKSIDANGNVDDSSVATTPNLKLYIVVYATGSQLYMVDPNVLKIIDGVNLWCYSQNIDYTNYANNVNIVEKNYPGKEIIGGLYISAGLNQMTPQSIQSLYQTEINLYDQGNISDVLTFAAIWLTQQYITQSRWDSLAIPPLLDTVYYPYLGEASGKIIDGQTNIPIQNALVTVQRYTNSGPITIAEKYTASTGAYDFGAWAGKDSLINYRVKVEDSSYATQYMNVQLQAGQNIDLPDIKLDAITGINSDIGNIPSSYKLKQNYPNPFNPSTTISYSMPKEANVVLKVFNYLGQEVSTLVNKIQAAGNYNITFNADSMPSGVYFYSLRSGGFTQVKKMLLLK